MNNDTDDSLDQQVQDALKELGLDQVDLQRRVSASDMLYLIDRCPFLQIVDTAPQLLNEVTPMTLVTAKSGWKIHDYEHALSSSPGEWLYGGGDFRIKRNAEDDEGGAEGTILNPGKGTLINQAVVTAHDMVELAQQHGWTGIQIVDGHPLMVWGAWMAALDAGMTLEGYEPTTKDWAKRERIKRKRPESVARPRPPI